jgi:hypothetical protein
MALVVLASQGPASGLRTLGLSGIALLALAMGVGASRGLPRLLFGRSEPAAGPLTQAAFAALLLGWGPLMAYQLGNVPALGTLRLSAEPGSAWTRSLPVADVSLMSLGQVGVIVVATVVAALALSRARGLAAREGHEPWAPGWRLAALAGWVYAAAALALTLQ